MNLESIILEHLFNAFSQSNVNYCVLRNYATLPESLGGSDLDLAVLPDELPSVAYLVIEMAEKFGGSVIMDYTSSGRMMRLLGCHEGEWWGMAIDLFSSIEYRGVEYISTHRMIDRAVDHYGIKVSPDYDADITALVKELLSNGKTRKNYFPKAVTAYQKHGTKSLSLLADTFHSNVVESFQQWLEVGKDDLKQTACIVSKLRSDVLWREWWGKIPDRILNSLLRARRIMKPVGSSIVVLGTDGSGKTTMIDAITPVLEQALHSRVQYEHLRPNWLPALGVATGKRGAGSEGVVTNPHAQKPSGFFGSMMRLSYYSLDYTIGYWIKVHPKLVKRPHICLFDRYYYDFLLDPRRMCIALPQWVMRSVFLFAPQPKLIFCLGGDPEVIYARKPETSLEEVKRQVSDLKKFCENNPKGVWIDTEVGIEDSKHQILSAVNAVLSVK